MSRYAFLQPEVSPPISQLLSLIDSSGIAALHVEDNQSVSVVSVWMYDVRADELPLLIVVFQG